MSDTQRVMRIAFPVNLIHQMDSLIQRGEGGYETRTEMIVDSVRQNVELLLAEAGDAPVAPGQVDGPNERKVKASPAALPLKDHELAPHDGLESSEIRLAGDSQVVESGSIISQPEGKPLFGMHNRDYPSLWAACRLAAMTTQGPVPVEQYFETVASDAWQQGEVLRRIQEMSGRKTTALFPTNPDKRKSAEDAFRMFAIGRYTRHPDDARLHRVDGPLFEWQVAALTGIGSEIMIGLTSAGKQLLARLDGLTVDEPHPPGATKAFLSHLAEWASTDHQVLLQVVSAVGSSGATRPELLDSVSSLWPGWTTNEVSTNTAGYVARAREWGLLKAKQEAGRYRLSDLGHQYKDENETEHRQDGETK